MGLVVLDEFLIICSHSSLNFLDRRISISSMPSSHGEDWQPLVNYRNSLLHGETDQAAVGPMPVNKKVYTRKGGKKNPGADDETEDAGNDFN